MSPAVCIAFIISPVLILLLLRVYCRLTVGRCRSLQDMTGKTILITGASAGIGKTTALDLARRNARVLLACRNLDKAEKVKSEIISATGNTNVEVKLLDLESFESVRKCARDLLKTESRLDVLINNAGMAHLLKRNEPSRIINVASIVYLYAVLNLGDMDGKKHGFFLLNIGNYYNRSKLANILFTTELARRLEGTGVTVNAVHPGLIHSDIFYKFNHPVLSIYKFLLYFLGKNTEEGAQTTIYLSVHPEVRNTSGKFFADCREMMLVGEARNRGKARQLFEISEKIVGETFQ